MAERPLPYLMQVDFLSPSIALPEVADIRDHHKQKAYRIPRSLCVVFLKARETVNDACGIIRAIGTYYQVGLLFALYPLQVASNELKKNSTTQTTQNC